MTYLLDTDHITLLMRRSGSEDTRLRDRIDAHDSIEFTMSVVSFHEQFMGANALIARNQRPELLRGYDLAGRVLDPYCPARVLEFESAAMAEFERLRNQRVRIGTMDLRIAAIAIANELTLLTRNTVDFSKVPGLVFEDWTTP